MAIRPTSFYASLDSKENISVNAATNLLHLFSVMRLPSPREVWVGIGDVLSFFEFERDGLDPEFPVQIFGDFGDGKVLNLAILQELLDAKRPFDTFARILREVRPEFARTRADVIQFYLNQWPEVDFMLPLKKLTYFGGLSEEDEKVMLGDLTQAGPSKDPYKETNPVVSDQTSARRRKLLRP